MKVAFWNDVSLFDNVTNHVAAIGTILALEYHCEVVLGSNFISNRMLQDCFFSKIKEAGVAHAPYRYLYESPDYYAALWKMKQNRQGDVLEIPMEGITIIFPPDVAEHNMFYFKVPRSSLYLLDTAEENSAAFQSALEEAELVIVFLPQNKTEIQKFFHHFSSLIPKTIFVIEKALNTKEDYHYLLKSKYGINSENIKIIPKCNEFTEACEDGRLLVFLEEKRKEGAKGQKNNYIFSLRKLAKCIFERSKSELVREVVSE